MKEFIIAFINARIATLGHFSDVKGLCELITKGDKTFPAFYANSGELKSVVDFDLNKGLCYHRNDGSVTDEQDDTLGRPLKIRDRTFPLRVVCVFPKDLLKSDNAYIADKIAENVVGVIEDPNSAELTTSLKAYRTIIQVDSYETDTQSIEASEDIKLDTYKLGACVINYTVTVTASKSCFELFGCGDETIPNFNKATVIDGENPNSPILISPGEEYTCETGAVEVLGYDFPLTGATTIYPTSGGVSGDDAFIEINLIAALRPTDQNFRINVLVDFFTLNGNNKWDTTERFTDDAGGQDYTNDIVQVHDLGIELYRIVQSSTNWNTAIPNSLGTNFTGGLNSTEGKTNWSLINAKQGIDLVDYGVGLDYAPLNIASTNLWTSTTRDNNSTQAFIISTREGSLLPSTKTNNFQYIFVRPIE